MSRGLGLSSAMGANKPLRKRKTPPIAGAKIGSTGPPNARGSRQAGVEAVLDQQAMPAVPETKLSAPEMAVRAIQGLIRRKALRPGERLPAQRELSTEISVSRTSLREALSTLEALGVVRTAAGRGTFVNDAALAEQEAVSSWRFSNRYELREVYEFRYLVESSAVRLAAMNITDEELTSLRLLHGQYKAALNASDFMASAAYDFQFHRSIMVCSRNRVFVDIYDKFHKVFQQTQMLPFSRKQRRWEAAIEHGKILEALQHHDPDGAAFCLEMHLLRATDRIGIKLSFPK